MSYNQNGSNASDEQQKPGAEAIARVENGKMTRRAALAKVGIRAGIAVFAALNVDTIARMVGVELQRQGRNSRVADKLAREFRNAGLAFADPGDGSGPTSSGVGPPYNQPNCSAQSVYNYCSYHLAPGGGGVNACDHCCEKVYGDDGVCKGQGGSGNGNILACELYCANN